MTKEKGTVLRTDGDTAWIMTKKTSACKACSSRDSCNMMGGGKDMEVKATNLVDAKTGDRVIISFETSKLLKVTFLVYIFPIIAMLIGATIGNEAGLKYGIDRSIASGFTAFLFFAVSFLFIRFKSDKMAGDDSYKPKIIKII